MHEEKLRRRRSSKSSNRRGDLLSAGQSADARSAAESSRSAPLALDGPESSAPPANRAEPVARLSSFLPAAHVGAIVVATILVYLTALNGPFVFDDMDHIVERARLGGFDRAPLPIVGGLRSTCELTFWMNYRLSGTNPLAFRLTNVLIHAAAGIVLYDLVRRTLRRPRFAGRYDAGAPWIAAAVAAIWTLHPLQTQAVSYIVQRMESLMGLFFLLTLYAMLRATESSRGTLWRVAAVGFFVLGLTTKEVMFVAPLIAVAFERIFLSTTWNEVLRKWRWFLPPAGVAVALGAWRISQSLAASTVIGSRSGISSTEYFLNQSGVILHYLRLVFLPIGQNADYLWPVSHDPVYLATTTLIVTAILAVGVWALYRHPPIGFLVVSFFVVLAPTSSFIAIQDLAVEHRMYLASICVVALAVVAVVELSRRLAGAWLAGRRRTILAAAGTIVVATLAVTTLARNQVYASDRAFWEDVAAKAPHNVRGWIAKGRLAIRDENYDAATAFLERALTLKPNNVSANVLLAQSLAKLDQDDPRRRQAFAFAEKARRLDPADDEVASAMGLVLMSEGKPAAAYSHFEKAAQADPRQPAYLVNLAIAGLEIGRFEEAESSLAAAVALDPEFPDGEEMLTVARATLAATRRGEQPPPLRLPGESDRDVGDRLARAERFEEAAEFLKKAVAQKPEDDRAFAALAVAEARMNRGAEAVRLATEATRLAPAKSAGAYALGIAHAASGDHERALAAYEQASRIDARDANIHAGRALSLAALGRKADAAEAYLRAIELDPRNPSPCNNLGNLLTFENPPLAEKYFRQALALEPNHVNARLNLGNLLARTGRLSQALTEYDAILAARPGYTPAERSRAAVLAMMKPAS